MAAPAAARLQNKQFSELSRFWELEAGSDCGTFSIRGYRPHQPVVDRFGQRQHAAQLAGAGHSRHCSDGLQNNEARIQLSVRTKIAQGLLTGQRSERARLAVVWLQPAVLLAAVQRRPLAPVSHHRPRARNHLHLPDRRAAARRLAAALQRLSPSPVQRPEPAAVAQLEPRRADGGHGKGQRLPRDRPAVEAHAAKTGDNDDNPDISNTIGRAEVAGFWNVNKDNTLGVTLRHSLQRRANGSVRLEWLQHPGQWWPARQPERPALSHPAVQRLRRFAGGLQPPAHRAEHRPEPGGLVAARQCVSRRLARSRFAHRLKAATLRKIVNIYKSS